MRTRKLDSYTIDELIKITKIESNKTIDEFVIGLSRLIGFVVVIGLVYFNYIS